MAIPVPSEERRRSPAAWHAVRADRGKRAILRDAEQIYHRYQDLQDYVGWTDDDAARVHELAPLLESHLPALVEDFYAEIARHAEAHKVFTGGQTQIDRLRGSLLTWLARSAHGSLRSRLRGAPLAGGSTPRRNWP